MLRRLFGDDVAENDTHLSEYFIETPAYRMALSGEKRFIIGRKGAGKSAICQQLQKQLPQSGALCILYDIGFLKSRGQGKVWQSARHPDFNIALAEEFSVHPAFRRYLRIGQRK